MDTLSMVPFNLRVGDALAEDPAGLYVGETSVSVRRKHRVRSQRSGVSYR